MVKEFKYIGTDSPIELLAAVLQLLSKSVMVKQELDPWKELYVSWSIYIPVLTYGRDMWVVTERIRSLNTVAGLTLSDRVRTLTLQKRCGVELLLL